MTDYAPMAITTDGVAPTANPAATGDKLTSPGERRWLNVKNGGSSSVTLTIDPAGKTAYGVDNPAKTWTIPASGEMDIPVLAVYGDPADGGKVPLAWSATDSVTFAYKRI